MEATTENIVVGNGTTPTGLTPGVMMKKQVLEYLKRTTLRRASLITVAAELGLAKSEHATVGKVLKELEEDRAVVRVEDCGAVFWRVANAGEQRKAPGLFGKMVEGKVQPSVEPEKTPDLTCTLCDFKASNENGLKVHMSRKHKDAPLQSSCAICGKVFDPRGLGPHMRTHKLAQASCSTPTPPGPAEEDKEEDDDGEDVLVIPEASDKAQGFERLVEDATKHGWTVEVLLAHRPFNGGMLKMSYTTDASTGVRL